MELNHKNCVEMYFLSMLQEYILYTIIYTILTQQESSIEN